MNVSESPPGPGSVVWFSCRRRRWDCRDQLGWCPDSYQILTLHCRASCSSSCRQVSSRRRGRTWTASCWASPEPPEMWHWSAGGTAPVGEQPMTHLRPLESDAPVKCQRRRRGFELTAGNQERGRSLAWPGGEVSGRSVTDCPSSPGCRRPPSSSRCHGNGTWRGGACGL